MTPTASVEAVQEIAAEFCVTVPATRPEGAVGAVVSSGGTVVSFVVRTETAVDGDETLPAASLALTVNE